LVIDRAEGKIELNMDQYLNKYSQAGVTEVNKTTNSIKKK